uniref:Uncharacterized protein n=1 Tax=Panagrolaimus sp. ES5 TaxID=591445 RepID=A0AC34FNG3_9BILA
MVVGAYLMCSTGIRYKDGCGVELKWLPEIPKIKGRMKPSDVRIRADLVFKQVPVRLSNLVIVNSNLSSFEMLHAAVETAEKYADNVTVIPPLLARLTFALEQLANPIMERIPSDETILVVTIVEEFSDFVILRRDENFDLYIARHEIYKREECDEFFGQFYDYYYPHSTIFLVHEDFHNLAFDVRYKYRPERSFLKVFKRWDFMLFFGGLYRSVDNDKEFDQRYHMQNFTNGYEATIRRNGPNIRHILLPEKSKVPCEMFGFDGIPQNIKINYSPEFTQVFKDLIWESRFATEQFVYASGSAKQVIGYVDERGVPYATPRKEHKIDAVKMESPSVTYNRGLELSVDFVTGNICEYNASTKAKTFKEKVIDPMKLSSSVKQLTNLLSENPVTTLHIITDKEIPDEYNDLFNHYCNDIVTIPHIKTELSICFKKLKNEENLEKFALIFASQNRLMDLLLFEYRSQQYYFIQRVQDLTVEDVEMKIKSEYVKDVFMFRPRGVQLLLDIPDEDVTVNVFEIRDFENMALNGIFDMDVNLKDLTSSRDLKSLFSFKLSSESTSPTASDTYSFSQVSTTICQDEEPLSFPQAEFVFHEDFFAVNAYKDGNYARVKDSNRTEWTPLYLSMANGAPVLGEKAKSDYQKSSECVIYDVLKIIGKSMNEITVDPKWGFKLVEEEEIVYFEIETPSGKMRFPQELVLSAFLKAMKLRAESNMGTEINEICLSTNFNLTESQKTIFNKAAIKNNLEILSFNVTDI